jgi:hypothetical protein
MFKVRSGLYIIAAMIALIAAPALAQSGRKVQPPHSSPPSPYGVYSGQRRIGTDPDPNVRFEILRQENWRKGG